MPYADYALAAYEGLMVDYDHDNGLWNGCLFWQSANAINAIINYSSWSPIAGLDDLLWNTFTRLQGPSGNFHYGPHHGWTAWLANHFGPIADVDPGWDIQTVYDDEAWWALVWLRAHDITVHADRKQAYRQSAIDIHINMTSAWSWPCGGGLFWNTPVESDSPRQEKNAIENELFLALSARLYRTTGDPIYLSWAQSTLMWFTNAFLDHTTAGLINDGLDLSLCIPQNAIWTYNQGVILGGLADMFQISAERPLLDLGYAIFQAVKAQLADPATGALVEQGGPTPSDKNHRQFKGIFMGNLSQLFDVESDAAHLTDYASFFTDNANAIWNNDRSEVNSISHPVPWAAFGYRWEGPFDTHDAARQSSALEVLVAAIRFDGVR